MKNNLSLVNNFRNGIKEYINSSWCKEELEELTIKDIKCIFISDAMFGLTTYDGELDIEFGKDILEIMKVIANKENFKYMENESDYKKFIIVANLLNRYSWIEWGTSIRGCWFDTYGNPTIEEDLGILNMEKINLKDEDISELLEYLSSDEL